MPCKHTHTHTHARTHTLTDDALLLLQDISSIVGTIWSSDCRGDQAYFFRRKSGVPGMANGSIVSLVDGELVPDTSFAQTVRVSLCVGVFVCVCVYI